METELDVLVRRARDREADAFEQLWRTLSPRVTGYLRGRGVGAADDVTSDVFLAAFQGLATFEGDGAAFLSWLFTIAHHKAADSVRRGRVHTPYDQGRDRRRERSAEDCALENLGADVLQSVLGSLTEAQREVILLRVIGDLDLAEVAELIGSTPGAVRQLQKRAIASLRARLADPKGRIPAPRVPESSPTAIAELP